jgi:hypothetical protein
VGAESPPHILDGAELLAELRGAGRPPRRFAPGVVAPDRLHPPQVAGDAEDCVVRAKRDTGPEVRVELDSDELVLELSGWYRRQLLELCSALAIVRRIELAGAFGGVLSG